MIEMSKHHLSNSDPAESVHGHSKYVDKATHGNAGLVHQNALVMGRSNHCYDRPEHFHGSSKEGLLHSQPVNVQKAIAYMAMKGWSRSKAEASQDLLNHLTSKAKRHDEFIKKKEDQLLQKNNENVIFLSEGQEWRNGAVFPKSM